MECFGRVESTDSGSAGVTLIDEIAAYGTARTFAHHLGLHDIARLLQATLDEERETDEHLTSLAERRINASAEQQA
jgi:ferritin-like metal-binding protein YciE